MLYKGNKWAAYSLGPVKNVCCTRHKILRTPMIVSKGIGDCTNICNIHERP
jgi:hypothetical protein